MDSPVFCGMRKSAVIKFRTGNEPTPKTVGIIVDLNDTEFNSLAEWTPSEISGIYKLHKDRNEELNAAAKGKVILIDRTEKLPKAICYQANGKIAEPAWCGNSYAAASAYLHREGCITQFIVINQSVLSVNANVALLTDGNYTVSQAWEIERQFVLNDTQRLFRHRAIFLRFLNDYRVIVSRTFNDFEKCADRISKQLSTLRINEKICLLHPQSGHVRFFTSYYPHGAAPVTGLCSIALLKQKVGWLGERMSSNTIITPRGEEELPELKITGDKISININKIIVNLQNL